MQNSSSNDHPVKYTALDDHHPSGGDSNNILAPMDENRNDIFVSKSNPSNNSPEETLFQTKPVDEEKKKKTLNKFFTQGSRRTTAKIFPQDTLSKAINLLVYGSKVYKFSHRTTKRHQRLFYIYENDDSFLQWISPKKKYLNSRLDLRKVTNISEETITKLPQSVKKKPLLCIETTGKPYVLVLEFPNPELRLLWWQGLDYFEQVAKIKERSK